MFFYSLSIFLILLGLFLYFIRKDGFFGGISLFFGIVFGLVVFTLVHVGNNEISTDKYRTLKSMYKEYPEINADLKLYYADHKITNDEYVKIRMLIESKRKDFLEKLN